MVIKVKKHTGGFTLCQSHYIEKNKVNLIDIKKANTSYDVACMLSKNFNRTIVQVEYASAIDSLCMACIALSRILHS